MRNLPPHEFRKTVALFFGIVLTTAGLVFIAFHIQAEGIVDFHSNSLTGTVKSASAGVIVVVIGAFIIMWSTLPSKVIKD
jgi:hypothetical protein